MSEAERQEIRRVIEVHGVEEVLRFVGEVVGEAEFKKCSFCGTPREQATRMIAAGCGRPFGFICSDCINLCNQIIADVEN